MHILTVSASQLLCCRRSCREFSTVYPPFMNWMRTAALLFPLILTASAENWPQFRGPRGDGTSTEKNLPTRWSPTENVAWKTAIPGEGHSSPIVWDESVFLTTALPNGDRLLLRLNAHSGKLVWKSVIAHSERESMHRENSSASSTPVTDGTHIFTSFQVGDRVDMRAYDFDGKLRWSKQPLKFSGEHGYSYSPIVYKDLVILDCRQEGEAATIAFEKANGKERWRVHPRKKRISHITPIVINDGNREQLIVSGSDETASYDPASGKELWWCKGPSDVAVAGLSYGEGLVFTTAGYPTRTRMAVRTSGQGDVTRTGIAWKSQRQVSYVPSPVYHQGHLYTVIDESMLFCFDAKTGEAKWEQRLPGRFRSSLVLATEMIYATNDKGLTTIFRATPDSFQQLAANNLNELTYATPAVSNGRIYLRTGQNLHCIGPAQSL
jgi:outer membrane protein assembly factor BamB